MTQLLNRTQGKNYREIAANLSKELAIGAVERDRKGGLPTEEVQQLRDSGLLSLVVPKAFGGIGASWVDAYQVIRELAKADGSVGQLFSNHLILSTSPVLVGTPAQAKRYYHMTAQHNLFWANAVNTRDTRLRIEPEDSHYRVNGVKAFGTGVVEGNLRVFSAIQPGVELPIFFVVPKDRRGITYNYDWDNMGQRRTASGSFTFQNVIVTQDEILGPPPSPEGAFPTFLTVIVQLTKTFVYLGITEGAFEAAREYTQAMARPWISSGVDRASEDPYTLQHYGEFWMQLRAAMGLAEQAAQQVQAAWEKGNALTHEERGEVAIAVSTAKAFAAKVGLDITTRIFDVMGARATTAKYGFDRYWRDLRTFTLHDPIDYKLREVGNWVLNQELPTPTQYS